MRKIALVMALIVMASMAFALDIAVGGNATLTAGYNLNSNDFGLASGNSVTMDLTIAEGSKSSSATQEWYGEVSVTGAKVYVGRKGDEGSYLYFDGADDTDDTLDLTDVADLPKVKVVDAGVYVDVPGITAKITNGTYYVIIASNPKFDFGLNTPIEDGDDTDDGEDTIKGSFTAGGTLMEGFVVDVMVGTATDWTADPEDNGGYSFGAKAVYSAMAAANVTVEGGVTMVANAFDHVAGGLKVSGTVDIITYGVAADVYMANGADADYDFGGDVAVTLGSLKITAAASLASVAGDFNGLDAKAGLSYAEGAISASVAAKIVDIALAPTGTDLGALVNIAGSYKVSDAVKIGGGTDIDQNAVDFGTAGVLQIKANVYAELSVLENTLFTIKWAADDLTDVGDEVNKIGYITFETKLSI